MRPTVLGLLLLMAACSPGERGGKPVPRAAPAPAVVAVAQAPAPAQPGTCEATVNKLVALSMLEAEASGKPWPEETRAKRHKAYLDRCTRELADGVVTRAAMDCVESAKHIDAARECLIAAAN